MIIIFYLMENKTFYENINLLYRNYYIENNHIEKNTVFGKQSTIQKLTIVFSNKI